MLSFFFLNQFSFMHCFSIIRLNGIWIFLFCTWDVIKKILQNSLAFCFFVRLIFFLYIFFFFFLDWFEWHVNSSKITLCLAVRKSYSLYILFTFLVKLFLKESLFVCIVVVVAAAAAAAAVIVVVTIVSFSSAHGHVISSILIQC